MGYYVNNIFLRKKKTNEREACKNYYRLIFNVKELDKHVRYTHYKMDNLYTCLQLMEPGCFLASLDISNAYHTIRMHEDFTKFFKFRFQSNVF